MIWFQNCSEKINHHLSLSKCQFRCFQEAICICPEVLTSINRQWAEVMASKKMTNQSSEFEETSFKKITGAKGTSLTTVHSKPGSKH